MNAQKPAKKIAAESGAPTTDAQLKKAIDDLDQVRGQISTILQSLRGVASGQLVAPAPPVDGPSVKKTPH